MTVRKMTEEDKRRAELIQQGIWPGPPPGTKVTLQKPGAKGTEAAKRRFGNGGR